MVKKTAWSDFKNFRKGGIIGIKIDEGDDLIGAQLTNGSDDIVLNTSGAQSIRFAENQLRDQGRHSRRPRIKLQSIQMQLSPQRSLIRCDPPHCGSEWFGQRTAFDEYRQQSRGGSGIIAMKSKK